MASYATRLKAGIEIQKPIAKGVFKIKAKLGELMPPKSREEAGAMKGKGAVADAAPFTENTIAAYRKLAKYADKIDAYCDACEDVPTQGESSSVTLTELLGELMPPKSRATGGRDAAEKNQRYLLALISITTQSRLTGSLRSTRIDWTTTTPARTTCRRQTMETVSIV